MFRHQRRIQYSIDCESGLVYSQVRGEGWAIPVYQFADFGNDGDFTGEIPMKLEKFSHLSGSDYHGLIHTRKIPVELKNLHRTFWGMKPLAS